MEDKNLIQASLKGDETAFRTLVEKYESLVAATVIGMLGPGAEADDAGQETFIRFYQSLDKFRGEAQVSTYLARIAMNLSLNAIKRRKRRQSRFFSTDTEHARIIEDKDARSDYNEDAELIHRAIQQLSPDFRAVVILRLMKGYNTRETAEILQIPLGTVLSRLKRAQNKLKKILEPYYGVHHESRQTRPVDQVI